MLLAQVQPDEFISGYMGRMKRLNILTNDAKLLAALCDFLSGGQCSGPPSIAALALAAGKELRAFIGEHSLLPFFCAITPNDSIYAHGDASRPDTLARFGAKLAQQAARLCPYCFEADTERYGRPYWRRMHQLPGILWCPEHGVELLWSPKGKSDFAKLPTLLEVLPPRWSDAEIAEMATSKLLKRYLSILLALLSAERSVSATHAAARIRNLATSRGFRLSRRGLKPTLSDILRPHLPKPWLTATCPAMMARREGEYCGALDGVTVGEARVRSYVLALAGLFESAEEALLFWCDGTTTAEASVSRSWTAKVAR